MPVSREKDSCLTPRRQNAIAWIIIALVFFLGARFLVSNPGSGDVFCITIPYAPGIPVFSCPFYSMTSLPCPFCGITRSVAFMVRGDLASSFHAHPLGPLLTLVMLLVIPFSFRTLIISEDRGVEQSRAARTESASRLVLWIVIGLLIASWIISLARHFGLINW
jgi:hypothetical protein